MFYIYMNIYYLYNHLTWIYTYKFIYIIIYKAMHFIYLGFFVFFFFLAMNFASMKVRLNLTKLAVE